MSWFLRILTTFRDAGDSEWISRFLIALSPQNIPKEECWAILRLVDPIPKVKKGRDLFRARVKDKWGLPENTE